MRKLRIVCLFVMTGVFFSAQAQEKSSIVRLDPGLDNILASDAKVEKLAGDLGMTEGPVWDRKGGYLLYSDRASETISKWDPRDGKVSVFLDKSYSNGITIDRQGQVVFTVRGEYRQIQRMEKDGRRTVLVSEFEGKRLNSPNDLVYKSDGSLYFSDPIQAGIPGQELSYNGLFRIKDGKIQLLVKDQPRPNGLAFSPDEKYLYVCDTGDRDKKLIYRYEVQRDGTLADRTLFTDYMGDKGQGTCDGMKVDERGNVHTGGPGGIWIFSPGGKHLGTVLTPQAPINMAFGDPDGKALYVGARSDLYRIRFKVSGIRP